MSASTVAACQLIRPDGTYDGVQGFSYVKGITKESVGSTGISMHLLSVPPGGRSKAHRHDNHETAIYIISGETNAWYGDRLQNHAVINAGAKCSTFLRACRTLRPLSAISLGCK